MNRRSLLSTLAVCAGLAAALPLLAQPPAGDAPKKAAKGPGGRTSPHETISAVLGGRGGPRVTITYGRPYSARGGKGEPRKIWGELVKWDKADRLGADEATTLLTELPITVAGKTLPAGAYTLYIVASESGVSKLAFSTRVGKWGIPVDETKDAARFDLTKESLENSVDQLTLTIVPDGANLGGKLTIAWEKTKFSLPFTLQK
ncbi:MAG: DUF2911 domain-containing protein [Verrucomicrobia bacterium]|nr:DUF2911 domain-containing protein [Verrucomicrobiota bacterium]